MQVREALIKQSPSLALQRAAADEIAKLDDLIESQNQEIKELEKELRLTYSELHDYQNRDFPETRY